MLCFQACGANVKRNSQQRLPIQVPVTLCRYSLSPNFVDSKRPEWKKWRLNRRRPQPRDQALGPTFRQQLAALLRCALPWHALTRRAPVHACAAPLPTSWSRTDAGHSRRMQWGTGALCRHTSGERACMRRYCALGGHAGAAALVGRLAPGRVGGRRAPRAQRAPPDGLAAGRAHGGGVQLPGACGEPTRAAPCSHAAPASCQPEAQLAFKERAAGYLPFLFMLRGATLPMAHIPVGEPCHEAGLLQPAHMPPC